MLARLEIRDPIHGFIHREPHEQGIIDTALFQRLRRIKQLALATLVYPGAVHTRFDHSIGAFHIASVVARKLLESHSERRLVRLAALLHDIGHGPFSHVSEEILELFANKEKLKLEPGQQVHEAFTEQIIQTHKELGKWITEHEREQIVGLLEGKWGDSILKSIISGPIDVDKQDYLLRDSHFCGVKYGIYDLDRLIDTLRTHEDADDRFLALSVDGIHALEQFVLARYYMTTQVYRHKVRLISDAMIVRGITLGIESDKLTWLKDLYAYDGSDEHMEEYLDWNDERLTSKLLDKTSGDGYAKDMFKRLAGRRLLKRIFCGRPLDFPDPQLRDRVFQGKKELMDTLEERVAKEFGFDRHLVIARLVTVKSVRAQLTGAGQVTILQPQGPRLFLDESILFRSIDQSIQEQSVEVYAPAEYVDDKDKRKRRREYHAAILRLIDEIASPQSKLFD